MNRNIVDNLLLRKKIYKERKRKRKREREIEREKEEREKDRERDSELGKLKTVRLYPVRHLPQQTQFNFRTLHVEINNNQ